MYLCQGHPGHDPASDKHYNKGTKMKYFTRSVKYFFYFSFLTAVIILALVVTGLAEGNINEIFEDGWNAIWKIAIFFALIAAVYPKFGFVSRKLDTAADWDTVRNAAEDYFREKPFKLECSEADRITFRRSSPLGRLAKMYEDRITLSRTDDGYFLEGLRKDVFMYASGLEYSLPRPEIEE